MKKSIFLILATLSVNSFASSNTVSYIGNPSSNAGINWTFEGYRINDAKINCNDKADFSYAPQDGYNTVKIFKAEEANAKIIENKCSDTWLSWGQEDNSKKCVVTGVVKSDKSGSKYFIKIVKAELVTMPVHCQ